MLSVVGVRMWSVESVKGSYMKFCILVLVVLQSEILTMLWGKSMLDTLIVLDLDLNGMYNLF